MDIEVVKLLLGSMGVTSAAAIIAVVLFAFLSKRLFEHKLTESIEEFRAELQLISSKTSIQYSKLHLDRAEAIKTIYSKILLINQGIQLLESYSLDSQEDIDRFNNTNEAFWELKQYTRSNYILFDDSLRADLENLLGKYQRCFSSYKKIQKSEKAKSRTYDMKESGYHGEKIQANWKEFGKIIHDESPVLLGTLETQFKELLGV